MRPVFRCALLGLLAQKLQVKAEPYDNGTPSANPADSGLTSDSATQTSSSISHGPLITPTFGNGTCWSRTANYVTHTLPQQCLRTERTATKSTRSSDIDDGVYGLSASDTDPTPGQTSLDNAPLYTTSEVAAAEPSAQADARGEHDSPLDNANFLSFEDWKRQNQVKAEQAAEQGGSWFAGERQRPGINNALDSLGDEGEIEIDFSGFGSAGNGPRHQQAAYRTTGGNAPSQSPTTSSTLRSKDAGKTCKERTNYASFDCAATVLKNNPECKSASSILVENKDSYMLNTCSATNKFIVVELCNDILIDTVVLANFEFFSSIFRQFRVSVSNRYPVPIDKWVDLGTFEARNTREIQAFLVEHSQIWARFLRIEFLTHYGSEYYCPVSLLRVHGMNMLEDVRSQEDAGSADHSGEQRVLEPEEGAEATGEPVVPQEPVASTDETSHETAQAIVDMGKTDDVATEPPPISDPSATDEAGHESYVSGPDSSLIWTVNISGVATSVAIPVSHEPTCAPNAIVTSSDTSETVLGQELSVESLDTAYPNQLAVERGSTAVVSDNAVAAGATRTYSSESRTRTDDENDLIPSLATTKTRVGPFSQVTFEVSSPADATETSITSSYTFVASPSSSTSSIRSNPATTSNAAHPQPSTQDSFFKSIHKRLQQLEANSTLSLQYIEEQSRILRDAFSKVEKRQIAATTTFLTNLNETVMIELRGFRQAYDQLWQSTVIELEGQREQYQREMLALSSRLTFVADELVWQKRMGIVQSTLLLLCLGLVLFARGGSGGYFDVPLMQQMRNKSFTGLNRRTTEWESPPASPSPESRSPVRFFKRGLMWRSHTEPSVRTDSRPESRPESKDGPREEPITMGVKVEPPTPESQTSGIATPEIEDDDDEVEDFREVQSSPSTPTGTRGLELHESTKSWDGEGIGVT